MCANCTLDDCAVNHVDGTVLDKDLRPIFSGSEEQIMDYIMQNPLEVHAVWVSGEGEAISIDEWTEWIEDGHPTSG